jgi:hypothetical protein
MHFLDAAVSLDDALPCEWHVRAWLLNLHGG